MTSSSQRPGDDAPSARAEHAVLRASIVATVLVAALGIVAGLASGSFAVVFDGVYSLFDALASVVALLVARMIADYAASGERSRELGGLRDAVHEGDDLHERREGEGLRDRVAVDLPVREVGEDGVERVGGEQGPLHGSPGRE